MQDHRGFTLVELMIVIVVIGILAAIAAPNFISLREKSSRGSCVSNQRNIIQAATLYAVENNVAASVINISVLTAANYTTNDLGECPESPTPDFDDYTITIAGFRPTAISCDFLPAKHAWTPPP